MIPFILPITCLQGTFNPVLLHASAQVGQIELIITGKVLSLF
jgi:hypothetical protein